MEQLNADQSKKVFENIKNLKSEEKFLKLASLRQLGLIVQVLGPERSNSELFPYMHDVLEEDEEILIALCESLINLPLDYSNHDNFKSISHFLEEMMSFRSRKVRKEARKAMIEIFKKNFKSKANRNIIYTLNKLMIDGNRLKKYNLACLISTSAQQLTDEGFKKLLEIVRELINGTDLEIRTKTFEQFQFVIQAADRKFERMLTDITELGIDKGPDFVSSLGVQNLIQLSKLNKPVATSILRTLSSSSTWRVRYSICNQIENIGQAFGNMVFRDFITKSLSDYLLDQNSETKVGALDALPKAAQFMDAENLCMHLIPCLSHLVNDTDLPVRVTLATRIPYLVERIGKKRFNDQILPLILTLLRDEMQEVRSAILDNFEPICSALNPISIVDSLYPVLNEMQKNLLWRYRASTLDFIIFLTKKVGREVLKEQFIRMIHDSLRDPFESIRIKTADMIIELIGLLGEVWVVEKIFPELERLEIDSHYKFRLAYCKYIEKLAFEFTGTTTKKMIQSLYSLAADPIPIVRINASKTISSIAKHKACSPVLRDSFKVTMQKLTEDRDNGVAFTAKEVLLEL